MMSTTATAEPLGFIVWFRPHVPRARWRKVGVVRTRMDALGMASAKGDWRIEECRDAKVLAEASGQESRQGAGQRPNETANAETV
jgi:hypothetical protein